MPVYLILLIKPQDSTHHLYCSSMLLLYRPTTRTQFADRAFHCSAPSVWNYLDSYIVDIYSLFLNLHSKLSYSVRLLLFISEHECSCPPEPRICLTLWRFRNLIIIIIIILWPTNTKPVGVNIESKHCSDGCNGISFGCFGRRPHSFFEEPWTGVETRIPGLFCDTNACQSPVWARRPWHPIITFHISDSFYPRQCMLPKRFPYSHRPQLSFRRLANH